MTARNYVTFRSYEPVFLFIAASVLTSTQGHLLEFVVEPSDTVVQPGNSAVLDCVVKSDSATNTIYTQWLDQDRQMLTFIGDSYRSQLTNGSLYISSVSEELGLTGNYQCKASNGVESIVSRSANLSLASLSGFLEEPRDITVYPRQKAYFACRVQASPSPRIRWLKDERPLQLDELRMTVLPSGALEIDEVTESDQGIYRCNASGLNSYRLSNKAVLIINGDREQAQSISRPYFIALPRSEVVAEGQNITLDCAANGNPTPSITWLKDGHNIDMKDLDSRFSQVGSTTSLKITNIQKEDAGTYQCRAENREDSDDATATVKVYVPPKFLKKPTDKVELTNKDVELECSVYGIPEPRITWLKNGEVINLSEYYQLVKGNNLKIMGLMTSDTGIFQCVASNAAGNIQASASLKVIDKERPKSRLHKRKKKPNQKQDDNPSFGETESRTLFTQLKPESSARLGDVNYGHFSHTNFDPHSIFSSLRTSDSNDSNLGDTLTAYTESSPFSKPITAEDYSDTRADGVPGPPQDLKAVLAEPRFVVLSWKPPLLNSEDIIAYSVYYRQENNERERVQNTTRARLEEINIRNLRPACVYHFRVVAYNTYGPGASSKSLTVTTKAEEHVPSQPLDLSAYATSSHSIHVSWEPPKILNGHIQNYIIYYTETLSSAEHKINTTNLDFDLMGLTVFTEYNIWVVAVNERGSGAASEEKLVRTFSAAPTAPPTNITLEPASTSITVRWEPPPIEGQNGILTGYKIRYRKQGNKGETATTPANNKVVNINDLDRGATYQFKLWAINVNGSGPSTDWYEVRTYENDMDETRVPGQPSGLQVRPTTDKIYVMWNPPREQKVKIRHYVLGWGKGIPDMYSHELDEKTRNYIINHLEPNSEYVLSVRASNQMGSGLPVYTTVRTSEEPPPEPAIPLMPPVGLKVHVLSPTSAILYWTDSTLSKTQYVSDNRNYIVQYTAEKSSRGRQLNVQQELNTMIDDLKPNTQYEFMVKVVKGKRESPWSMVVTNKTWELALNTAPRELKVHLARDNSQFIELEWQPPKAPNGNINGYVILYTTDTSKKDREWQAEAVKGDKHSYILHDLEPSTTYFFKIQARNSRGYGPFSSLVSFKTGENFGLGTSDNRQQKDGRGVFSGTTLLYLIVGGCLVAVITIATVAGILCCRRQEVSSPDRSKKGYQKGNQNIKPPDLWIHHDQMELKAMEKGHPNNDGASSSGAMTLPRSTGTNDFDNHDGHHHTNSLEHKRTYPQNSYMCVTPDDKNKRIVKPKPITLPVDSNPPREPIATATPLNSTTISQTSSDSTPSSRTQYTRPQYAINRAHVILDQNAMINPLAENPYAAHIPQSYDHPGTPQGYLSQPPPIAHVPPSYAPGLGVLAESQAGKRSTTQGHPLKSFTVPAPPPISAPGTPQPKHVVTQPQLTVRPSSSPYKKPPTSCSGNITSTPPSRISSANPPPHTAEEVQKLQPSHSTEELNQEMANLEGLMMTLNAITANEFEC